MTLTYSAEVIILNDQPVIHLRCGSCHIGYFHDPAKLSDHGVPVNLADVPTYAKGSLMMNARDLARNKAITPHRCKRCGNTEPTGGSWTIGYDAGNDPDYVGYQCLSCGNIQGLTLSTVSRKAAAKRRARENR